MPHNNVAIFIPHAGCPHMCSFCNQRSISGTQRPPSGEDVTAVCNQAVLQVKNKQETEIAFFGGSFTAIERSYMLELLQATEPFISENGFKGIRISTRPDCINEEILLLLKKYHVTAIELGVQSMSDEVLFANDRGHTGNDVINSAKLIKDFGFELGLQMMVGLYKSNVKLDTFTANEIVKLNPKTVRIYPVVILEGTNLADLYKLGEYVPMEFDAAVRLCADLLQLFQGAGIDVIKLGLHASNLVESQLVGGLYHPAFRELCESLIFRDKIEKSIGNKKGDYIIYVPVKSLSKAIGQRKSSINYFSQQGINIKIKSSDELENYNIKLI